MQLRVVTSIFRPINPIYDLWSSVMAMLLSSNTILARRVAAIAAVLIAAGSLSMSAQLGQYPDIIEAAQTLIKIAYPQVEAENNRLVLSLFPSPTKDWRTATWLELSAYEAKGSLILKGSVFIDQFGIEKASFSGPGSFRDRVDQLEKKMSQSPSLKGQDLAMAATKAGAKMTPVQVKSFFDARMQEQYTAVLGPITNSSERFVGRPEYAPEMVALVWVVELDVRRTDGRKLCYVLSFEPFAGQLLSLDRRRCPS